MAETLVEYVSGKLCDAVFQEVVFLCGVGDKVESVKRELNRIECFLRDADRKCGGDERVKNWVNELRSVSFSIEDAIDIFHVEVDIWSRRDLSIMNKITRIVKTPKKLIAIHKFGKKIDKIVARIDEIANSRAKYGIENLGESSGSGVRVLAKRPVLPDLDETELVGFGTDKENIVRQLLDETIQRRSVVSIVGSGGLGKTTVAQKAYSSDEVKSQFEVRMWLSISQEFKILDLLKKMLLTLRSIEDAEKELDEEHFMEEVNKSLQEKKYLLVMDDVWSDELWPKIFAALPDFKNGSRVLITSRSYNTAKAADAASEPYKLPFLNESESLQLLLKTALPNRDANIDCPTNLLDTAKKLAESCDGLPLALVVLGGLLSVKSPTPNVWEKVLETMVWNVEGKKCMDILSTSYDDMPAVPKLCFMYLACFPEDYEIDARHLIRLWVAEGFIPKEHRKSLEDTAEYYLEELAQRYMVIVKERRYDDSIQTIRVHDLLRDLAIDKAQQDNFVTVFPNKDANGSPSTVARRVAFQSSGNHQLKEHIGPNLRSFHCFDNPVSGFLYQDSSRCKMLKVYNIEGDDSDLPLVHSMFMRRSTQLRFFRSPGEVEEKVECRWISAGPIDFCRQILLKPLIGHLQTIDLRYLDEIPNEPLFEGPNSIWGIKTLRHVLFRKYRGPSGPPSWANLENLQTLAHVKDSASWQTELPNLINVSRLKLDDPSSLETVASLFRTLKNLKSLYFCSFDQISLDIANMQAFPFYQHLQKLDLEGKWRNDMDLQTIMLPPHLIKLRLSNSKLLKDPMPELEKLQNLKILILYDTYSGQKMICSAGGFPCLEQLELYRLKNLEQFEKDEGAMPTLKLLKTIQCKRSMSLPVHLTCRIERTYDLEE